MTKQNKVRNKSVPIYLPIFYHNFNLTRRAETDWRSRLFICCFRKFNKSVFHPPWYLNTLPRCWDRASVGILREPVHCSRWTCTAAGAAPTRDGNKDKLFAYRPLFTFRVHGYTRSLGLVYLLVKTLFTQVVGAGHLTLARVNQFHWRLQVFLWEYKACTDFSR